ncbi:TetR/AcrR family transcriptional regulator [Kitasatospora sp. SUK 42]|uniref:TetR/AcrR family transcriptional regulator n=1 Tax=Kitasatospora sp. SUK 42 TaxID=1588882 RepID=UPI0018CACF70|nr:TetR family transcriptional regulator [Kitasatospora sp. SUK 42]MBV2155587.1 TetR/AcrR family transcriptional regulator [Kitasatospora sp. SUK 42]
MRTHDEAAGPGVSPQGEPTRRTQAERRARAEAALLAAAARLVAEHGSTGVTLARVGEEAGFSRGLATHYFGSKAALLARLQDEALAEAMAAAAPERSGAGAVDELCRFARGCLEGVRNPTDLGRAFVVLGAEALAGASELTDAVAELDARTRGWAADVVGQGLAEGEVRAGVDPQAFGLALVGLVKGLVSQAAAGPQAFDVAVATAEAERWIRLALTAG